MLGPPTFSLPLSGGSRLLRGLLWAWAALPGLPRGKRITNLGRVPAALTLGNEALWAGPVDFLGGLGAWRTDGVNDFLGNNALSGGTNLMTAVVWVRQRVANNNAAMLSLGASGVAEIRFNGTGRTINATYHPSYTLSVNSAVAMPLNEWHMVSMVYDGSALTLYYDWRQEASASGTSSQTPTRSNIGCRDQSALFCDGWFGPAFVYTRPLHHDEIRDLYFTCRQGMRPLFSQGPILLTQSAGGGVNYPQSLGGSMASLGALPRGVNKALVGVV